MTEQNTNETRLLTPTVWKNSLLSFFKIILMLIFLAFYVLSVLFFVSPSVNVKVFRFLGLKKAEEASLVQVFEKTDRDADLYNLIVFEQEAKSYEKQLYYITLLSSRPSYDKFCDKLDVSGVRSAGEQKALIPYLCNTKSYLCNQKVKCLWNLNMEGSIFSFVYNSLKGEYKYEYTFDTFVELLNGKYSGDVLKEKYEMLLGTFGSEDSANDVETLLNQRIEYLQIKKAGETQTEKIIRLHTLSNLAKGKYLACYSVYGENDESTKNTLDIYKATIYELNNELA